MTSVQSPMFPQFTGLASNMDAYQTGTYKLLWLSLLDAVVMCFPIFCCHVKLSDKARTKNLKENWKS